MSILIDLEDELKAASIPIDGVRMTVPGTFQVDYKPEATAQHITDGNAIRDTFEAEYVSRITQKQQEATQAAGAKTSLQGLMTGLHGLSAEDKSYAIACRIMAVKDGATQQTILGIVDRPTAVAYITSKPEWTGATVATRALVGDVLEMIAGITQVLLVVLTDT